MLDEQLEIKYSVEYGGDGTWLVCRNYSQVSTIVARFWDNPGAPIDSETCARMMAEELNKRVLKRRMG